MCASYGLQLTADEARDEFDTIDERGSASALADWLQKTGDETLLPTGSRALNLTPIVRERVRSSEGNSDGSGTVQRGIEFAWWKLWVGGQPAKFPAINARVENLMGSGAWSGPTKSRRAIVPATWYFEKAYRFDLGGAPFGMAAIYNATKQDDGEWMISYAIVTQPAVERFAEIHDRMPLVLPKHFYSDWLDPRTIGDQGLLDAAVAAGRDVSGRLETSPK